MAAGCATEVETTRGPDDLAGENGQDGEAAKADGVDTFNLFTVVQTDDGLAVARAGRSTTTCLDGSKAASCPAIGLDFRTFKITEGLQSSIDNALAASWDDTDAHLLVKGTLVAADDGSALLKPSEIWAGQLEYGYSDATFVYLHDNNKRCITAPCSSTTETRLNSTRHEDTHGIDFSDVSDPDQATDTLQEAVGQAMFDQGVIVNGFRTHGKENGQKTTMRSVEQVYLRVM